MLEGRRDADRDGEMIEGKDRVSELDKTREDANHGARDEKPIKATIQS